MTSSTSTLPNLPWIEEHDNPWGIRLLDLRPITYNLQVTATNEENKENVLSYGTEFGASFYGQTPKNERVIATDLHYRIEGKLSSGSIFVPTSMEHKWAIFFDGDKLYFVRSWLREVVAIAYTTQSENQLHVHSIQGSFLEDEPVATMPLILNYLILTHGLHEVFPVPLPMTLQNDTIKAGMWAFSAFGNKAVIGSFDQDLLLSSDTILRTTTEFHIAIANQEYDKVKKLAETENLNLLADDGFSPLHWALYSKDKKMMTLLLTLGSDIDVSSINSSTPLMDAVQIGELDLVNILLDHHADVNKTDLHGFTALHRAAEMGRAEIVQTLLDKGADKKIIADGHTPLSLAILRQKKEVIHLLS